MTSHARGCDRPVRALRPSPPRPSPPSRRPHPYAPGLRSSPLAARLYCSSTVHGRATSAPPTARSCARSLRSSSTAIYISLSSTSYRACTKGRCWRCWSLPLLRTTKYVTKYEIVHVHVSLWGEQTRPGGGVWGALFGIITTHSLCPPFRFVSDFAGWPTLHADNKTEFEQAIGTHSSIFGVHLCARRPAKSDTNGVKECLAWR